MRYEIRITGPGGRGAVTAGHILGAAAVLYDGKEAVVTEGYSPYITGGWSRSDVVISEDPIDYPLISNLDALVAMFQDGLDEHWRLVKPDGIVIAEAGLVDTSAVRERRVIELPSIQMADSLGRRVVGNVILMGALVAATKAVSPEAVKKALADRFPRAVDLNMKAFDMGYEYVRNLQGSKSAGAGGGHT